MKKILTFIPLGIGISAAIIYVFNAVQFRVINNSATLMQILSNLKIYLYISIAGFISYFFVKILLMLNKNHEPVRRVVEEETDESYEPFETIANEPQQEKQINTYVPNYDYVPVYNAKKHQTINEIKGTNDVISKPVENVNYASATEEKHCQRCGEEVLDTDMYCKRCGNKITGKKPVINQTLRNVINVLEIVILILVIYFSLNMLFDYKESKDPSFKSPFKVSMTK